MCGTMLARRSAATHRSYLDGGDRRGHPAPQPGEVNAVRLMSIYAEKNDELWHDIAITQKHSENQIRRGLAGVENTTSMEDCALLWLLVRHFDRKHVFEIGTFIATTAMAMNLAVRRNGGILTTSDPVDYDAVPPYSGMRFLRGPSSIALRVLRQESRPVDFCFVDWIPDAETLTLMGELCTDDTVIAVHDYGSDPKGEMVVKTLEATWCKAHDGRWFMPGPITMGDGKTVNRCTAFFLPTTLALEI